MKRTNKPAFSQYPGIAGVITAVYTIGVFFATTPMAGLSWAEEFCGGKMIYENIDEEYTCWATTCECLGPDGYQHWPCDKSPCGIDAVVEQTPSGLPSTEENALNLKLEGGTGNGHYFINLDNDPLSNAFALHMVFNLPESSTFRAVEFAMNKWVADVRYEWAIQLRFLDKNEWRYWNPNHAEKWAPIFLDNFCENHQSLCDLKDGTDHTLVLEGEILSGKIYYERFSIDGTEFLLDRTVDPVNQPGGKLAVAVQIDGNEQDEDPTYNVTIDKVHFYRALKGDLDDNRRIELSDAITGLQLIAGSRQMDSVGLYVNSGEAVDLQSVIRTLKLMAGLAVD